MSRRRYDGSDKRLVLLGMLLDKVVCARVASQWTREGLFDNGWMNTIGSWAVKYFRDHSTPIASNVISAYELWAQNTPASDADVDAIERFLHCLNEEDYNKPSEYVLDVAKEVFQRTKILKEVEQIKNDLDMRQIDEATRRMINFQSVNLGQGSYVSFADDPSVLYQSLESEVVRPLVTYQGDLGRFVGDMFSRSSLIGFTAPDKTGKSWTLVDVAVRGIRKRHRVAFFDTGDSVESEVVNRFQIRIGWNPLRNESVRIPIEWDEERKLVFKFEDRRAIEPISVIKKFQRMAKEGALRISCHENGSISVEGIESHLDSWEREGWIPDIVVIDYADILAPPRGVQDTKDKIDETWKQLRRLSQRRHCLVVTATQSDASAYGKTESLLTRRNFAGRKTKNAHVNGMIGINVSPDDKRSGLARWNWIVRRRGAYNERDFCWIAGCLAIGNPIILSRWGR